MRKYKCYFGQEFYTIKDYKKIMKYLKKDKNSNTFLKDIAASYNMFKSMIKLKNLKLIKFSYEDGMEEEHIRFVDRIKKDIPKLERFITQTKLK